MYGIIICDFCKRYRIIDESSANSKCPFCGTSAEHKERKILFEDYDQKIVRDMLAHMSGFVPEEKPGNLSDADPLSSLAYRYEHTSDPYERMELLADGLTSILGSFSLEDVEEIDPKNAGKILKAMIDSGLVYESGPGRFSV